MSWIPPNYDVVKRRVRTVNNEPSLTKQEFKDVCDINQLVAKYKVTGELPQLSGEPMFANFADAPDYLGALDIIKNAKEQFDMLPSKVRNRFDNDPAEFLRYIDSSEPKAIEELLDLELVDESFRTELDVKAGKFHSSDNMDENKEHKEN